MEKICLFCEKKFETLQDKRHNYQRYCSHHCNIKHYEEKHKAEIKKRSARNYQLRKKRIEKARTKRRNYYKKHKELEQRKAKKRYHSQIGQKYYKKYYSKIRKKRIEKKGLPTD